MVFNASTVVLTPTSARIVFATSLASASSDSVSAAVSTPRCDVSVDTAASTAITDATRSRVSSRATSLSTCTSLPPSGVVSDDVLPAVPLPAFVFVFAFVGDVILRTALLMSVTTFRTWSINLLCAVFCSEPPPVPPTDSVPPDPPDPFDPPDPAAAAAWAKANMPSIRVSNSVMTSENGDRHSCTSSLQWRGAAQSARSTQRCCSMHRVSHTGPPQSMSVSLPSTIPLPHVMLQDASASTEPGLYFSPIRHHGVACGAHGSMSTNALNIPAAHSVQEASLEAFPAV